MVANKLEEAKVSVRVKLAALWATIMSLYIYADFFDQMTPSSIESFGDLMTPVGPLTPQLLLIFSIILIIPACMILLSVFLNAKLNKWTNIGMAILYSLMSFILFFDTIGSDWYQFYALYQAVEIFVFGLIVWTAWSWPRKSA